MNYLSNGQWIEAQDLVEISPAGAQAAHGQMTATFNGDVTSKGAISLATPAGEVFQSHPIGLFYSDPVSGKIAQVGAVQSSVGTLYPPNVVVFSNVLSGTRADLMLVWAKNGYEQNLVLKQSPPKPESFGLSSSSTRLQLWSAMDSCPVPQEQRSVLLDSGLEDHILMFSDSWFPVGAAFVLGDTPPPSGGQPAQIHLIRPGEPGTLPVAKSLVNIAGEQVLIEEINYTDLLTMLKALPQASATPPHPAVVELAKRGELLPRAPRMARQNSPMQVASVPYSPSGVVLDYVTLEGPVSGYTFTSGTTYFASSSFSIGGGGAVFQQNACIKFATNASLVLNGGSVSFPSTGSKVIFTSKDDNAYGQQITGSTAVPGYAANPCVWMYYFTSSSTVQNAQFRWAIAGIEYDESSGVTTTPSLTSSVFQSCQHGVNVNIPSDSLTLSGNSYCNVGVPVYVMNGRTSGSMTVDCGVLSVAMVNDTNRDLSGIDTNKNSQTECSFVVLDSTNIVAAFMSTHLSEYDLGDSPFPGIPSPRMTSWAVSKDGGTNFSDSGPISPISVITNGTTIVTNGAADPMHGDAGDTTMAYDPAKNVIYLLVNTSREQTNWYGARLWASTNKGQSFIPVNMDVPGLDTNNNHLVSSQDKPMIKVSSTNIYSAATRALTYGGGGSGLWAATSINGGTNWNLFHTFDAVTNGDVRGVDMVIVPDGTVYFFWLRGDQANGNYTNFIRYGWLSTNNTWSSVASIGQQINSTNLSGSGNPKRSNTASVDDTFITSAAPRVAYANGNIYIAYADLPSTNNGTTDRGDIFLIEAAVNWSTHALSMTSGPRKVNNDGTQTDQWDPSIAANPFGTELFIGYYSRQNDPTTNSWIMAYAARTYITNGLATATFDCVPISPTSFQPLFAGTSVSPTNTWAFDPVWPPGFVCLDTNAVADGQQWNDVTFCPPWPTLPDGFSTSASYANFRADDYTWSGSDSNYFYFAWCDCSRVDGTGSKTRPDQDIKFAKIKQ